MFSKPSTRKEMLASIAKKMARSQADLEDFAAQLADPMKTPSHTLAWKTGGAFETAARMEVWYAIRRWLLIDLSKKDTTLDALVDGIRDQAIRALGRRQAFSRSSGVFHNLMEDAMCQEWTTVLSVFKNGLAPDE